MSATAAVQTGAQGWDPISVVFRPPDAKEILFRATVDGKFGLFVMNADGTNVRTLVHAGGPRRPAPRQCDLLD